LVFWRAPASSADPPDPPAGGNRGGQLTHRSTDSGGGRRSTDSGGGRRSADGGSGGGGLLWLPGTDPLGQAATLMRIVAPDVWASSGPTQQYAVTLRRAVPFIIGPQ
jgi:hypothetical protein